MFSEVLNMSIIVFGGATAANPLLVLGAQLLKDQTSRIIYEYHIVCVATNK